MKPPIRTAARAALLLVLASVLSGSSCSWAFTTGDNANDGQGGGEVVVVQNATFGGWDVGPALSGRPGVVSVQSGWDGGSLPFLGEMFVFWTGHRRVTQVRFDPRQTSFAEVLHAVRDAEAGSLRVTVYAYSTAQRVTAANEFPADSLPRLRLRNAGTFTPR